MCTFITDVCPLWFRELHLPCVDQLTQLSHRGGVVKRYMATQPSRGGGRQIHHAHSTLPSHTILIHTIHTILLPLPPPTILLPLSHLIHTILLPLPPPHTHNTAPPTPTSYTQYCSPYPTSYTQYCSPYPTSHTQYCSPYLPHLTHTILLPLPPPPHTHNTAPPTSPTSHTH